MADYGIPHAIITEVGGGKVQRAADGLHLCLPSGEGDSYRNAQISDYGRSRHFRHRPPLVLEVRAYASATADALRGTAGFGFWNHPFAPDERGWRLPTAVWFFFSAPPSDMPLARGVPGHGWKAATFDARRPLFYGLLPFAPLALLLMRLPPLYRRLWPLGQRALGVSEALLPPQLLAEPHTYRIRWLPRRVIFEVDGRIVHEAALRLRAPLGFVAWIDNQFAVVTPQGRLRFGLVSLARPQRLSLTHLNLTATQRPAYG